MSFFSKNRPDMKLGTANSAEMLVSFPSSPERTSSRTRCAAGWKLPQQLATCVRRDEVRGTDQ